MTFLGRVVLVVISGLLMLLSLTIDFGKTTLMSSGVLDSTDTLRTCPSLSSAVDGPVKFTPSTHSSFVEVKDRLICFRGRNVTSPNRLGSVAAASIVGGSNSTSIFAGRAVFVINADTSTAEHSDVAQGVTLVIDGCLSVFHFLVDIMTHAVPWRRSVNLCNVRIILRSNCGVFHFGTVLLSAVFLDEATLHTSSTQLRDSSDAALVRWLRGAITVTLPPPDVASRAEDAAYDRADIRTIVHASSNVSSMSSHCSCHTFFVGEAPGLPTALDLRNIGTSLDRITAAQRTRDADQLWGNSCSGRPKVALVLRLNSRFLASPEQFLEHLVSSDPSLCVKPFVFDNLSALQQYSVVRTANAMIGVHGAALSWASFLRSSPPECSAALVELWFFGRFVKDMGVYRKLTNAAGAVYRRYMPDDAFFYDFGSHGTSLNSSTTPPPRHGTQWVSPSRSASIKTALKRLRFPHRSKYFFQQVVFFSNATVARIASTLAVDLKNCQSSPTTTT